MDDIGRLLLFADVVDAGGFSRAAARRGLTHSTVSKHVRSLEAELGVRLLHRTSRTMSLTEEGRLVLGYSRQVGDSVAALRDRLAELQGQVVGELRINCLLHVGRHLVQPAVERTLRAFPRLRVQLTLDDGPLRFSRDGYDVAVRVGLLGEGNLTASKLLQNDVCIVAAPAWLEHNAAPTHPAQLSALPTLGYRSTDYDISAWRFLEDGDVHSVDINPVCTASDGNALLDLAASGVGVAYVSEFAAKGHLERGDLVRLLTDFELPPFDPVFVFQAASAHPPRKVLAFRSHLADVAAEIATRTSGTRA